MTHEGYEHYTAADFEADHFGPEDEDDFPVVCYNGCPEGYLGEHKFSCNLAGQWFFAGQPVTVHGANERTACIKTAEGDHLHVNRSPSSRPALARTAAESTGDYLKTDGFATTTAPAWPPSDPVVKRIVNKLYATEPDPSQFPEMNENLRSAVWTLLATDDWNIVNYNTDWAALVYIHANPGDMRIIRLEVSHG